MLDSEQDLRAALGAAAGADQRLHRRPSGAWLLYDVEPSRLLQVWQAARRALPDTGRWPVCVWDMGDGWDVGAPGDPAAAASSLAAAAAQAGSAGIASGWINDLPETLDTLRHFTRHRFPKHPELALEMIDALGEPTTEPAFDRWLYDRLLKDPGLRAEVDVTYLQGTSTWFEPTDVALALLPTPQSWLSPAWLGLYSFESPERQAALAAVQRQWLEEYGAELVANWGTMLQFVVRRPPQDPERAYELAGQLKEVGGSLQMYRYELALALPGSDAWFVHNRP